MSSSNLGTLQSGSGRGVALWPDAGGLLSVSAASGLGMRVHPPVGPLGVRKEAPAHVRPGSLLLQVATCEAGGVTPALLPILLDLETQLHQCGNPRAPGNLPHTC